MTSTNQQRTIEGREMATLHSASLFGDTIPTQVLLAPWGQVESTNGSFIIDEEASQLTLDAFEEHATDLPIDYEHQTLGGTYASPNGRAPAAGWIKHLEIQPGVGLIAHIEWTQKAKDFLGSKEYRYLSPVAIIRKTDRKLVAIHSAALTNKPAIKGMQPIVNRVELEMDDHEMVSPLNKLRDELKLSTDTSPQEVLIAASERLVNLKQETLQRHVNQRVQDAVRAGKLVEAQREWAEALVAREEELFDEWFRTAPVVVVTGASKPPDDVHGVHRHRGKVSTRARSEFRANPLLSALTSEEAYFNSALRDTDRFLN